jgi:hypothetical protein
MAPAPALPVAAPSSERFALDYVLGGQRIGVIVDIGMCQILHGTDRRGAERTRDRHGCRMSLSNRPHVHEKEDSMRSRLLTGAKEMAEVFRRHAVRPLRS